MLLHYRYYPLLVVVVVYCDLLHLVTEEYYGLHPDMVESGVCVVVVVGVVVESDDASAVDVVVL